MNYLQKLIKESLQGYQLKKKIGCSCGCNTCGSKAPILNENKASRSILSEGLKHCIDVKKPLTENLYRAGSEKYFNLWSEARALYSRGIIDIKNQDDLEILTETQLGEFGMYEGKKVPLDFIMEEIEELNEIVTGPDKDFVLSIMQYLESKGKLDSTAKKTLFSYMNSPSGNREGVLAILKALESKLEINEAEGKKVPLDFIMEEIEEELPDTYTGNDNILYTKTKERTNPDGEIIANYKLTWNGHDIDPGGYNFGSFKELKDFSANYILSNQLYNKLRYEKPIEEELDKAKITTDNLLNKPKTLIINRETSVRGTQFKPGDIISVQYQFDDDDESFFSIKGYGQNNQNTKILYIPKKEMDNFLRNASLYLTEDKKKTPPIGKPKRGGSKKFYVYVRDKGKVKKVSFGQAGMSAKINNSKARAAFSKRHDCPNKKDKTKPSYWSCRLPRYAHLLGLKSKFSGFW